MLQFDFSKCSEDFNHELSEANELGRGKKKEVDLPMFSFACVSAATNNFCVGSKLGEGGFGPVYKVRLVSLEVMPFRIKSNVKVLLIVLQSALNSKKAH